MKPHEVIDILKMFTTDKFQRCTSSEFDDAIYTAIGALQKQMPKKPVVSEDVTCPNCSATLIYCFHTSEIACCDKCGQRLDWEGIE